MRNRVSTNKLGLSCREGGYICICKNKLSRFIGCCQSNPCETPSGECPDRDLKQSSFDSKAVNQLGEQTCVSDGDSDGDSDNHGAQWYVCAETKPPFLGCCASDASSQGGCDVMSLRAARLSDDHGAAASMVSAASGIGSDSNVPGRVLTPAWTGTAVTALGSSPGPAGEPSANSETGGLGLTHDRLVALASALVTLVIVFALTSAALLWMLLARRRKATAVRRRTRHDGDTVTLSSAEDESLDANQGALMDSMQEHTYVPANEVSAVVAPLFCQHPPQQQGPGQAVSLGRSVERTPSPPLSPRLRLSQSPTPGPAIPSEPTTSSPTACGAARVGSPANIVEVSAPAPPAGASPQSTKPIMLGGQINLERVRSRTRILSGMEASTGCDQHAVTFEDEWGRPEHA